MPDPTIIAGAVGAASTMAGGLFGWLRGRADSTTAQAKAQSDQLATLAKIVEQQSTVQGTLMDRAQRQSEKISALSAKLDEVRGQLADSMSDCRELREQVAAVGARLHEVEAQRDQLQLDLAAAQEQIGDLTEHVRALQQQVESLGYQPTPPPIQPRNAAGQFSKGKMKGRKP